MLRQVEGRFPLPPGPRGRQVKARGSELVLGPQEGGLVEARRKALVPAAHQHEQDRP